MTEVRGQSVGAPPIQTAPIPTTPIATTPIPPVSSRIAAELGVKEWQVVAAIELLDGGATVPFVARYRKEATGTLDDAQLRDLEERLAYLRELDDRRTAIIESIRAQGKLTAPLEKSLAAADSKARLEDIYLPFKTKRRTKAQIAREAGLAPLAELLLQHPENDPGPAALAFVDPAGESRTPPRRCWGPGPSWSSSSARTLIWSAACGNCSGPEGGSSPGFARVRRRTAPSSPTTSTSPSR